MNLYQPLQIPGFSWLAQQLFAEGTPSHPAVMAMDAWSDGDTFVIEFDLPGVRHDAVDIGVERKVLTVTAQRPTPDADTEMLAAERPTGLFSRQFVLGDQVDLERAKAEYDAGVLRLSIPVTERARTRKIDVGSRPSQPRSTAEPLAGRLPRGQHARSQATGWAAPTPLPCVETGSAQAAEAWVVQPPQPVRAPAITT